MRMHLHRRANNRQHQNERGCLSPFPVGYWWYFTTVCCTYEGLMAWGLHNTDGLLYLHTYLNTYLPICIILKTYTMYPLLCLLFADTCGVDSSRDCKFARTLASPYSGWERRKGRRKKKGIHRRSLCLFLLGWRWITMMKPDFGHGSRYWYLRESMAMGWMTETRRRIWSRLTQLCRWDGTSSLLFSPPASFLGLDN